MVLDMSSATTANDECECWITNLTLILSVKHRRVDGAEVVSRPCVVYNGMTSKMIFTI